MILVWGTAGDPPADRMASVLRDRSADVVQLGDEQLETLEYDVTIAEEPSGCLDLGGRTVPVSQIQGIYLRPGPAAAGRASAASMTLLALAASIPAVVVNRPAAGRSNCSKPFQLGLLAAAGFRVPETLVTTSPDAATEFLRRHGSVVYKSVSGVRSIVNTLDVSDIGRLDDVVAGPVQLQELIAGVDVRVHVVGDRCFATSVRSDAPDYRYAAQFGAEVEMAPLDLPETVAEMLMAATRRMDLLVSGADLRLSPAGDWVAFEVNPSPGFTFYEESTGQPIAAAIADLLLAGRPD